jgi:diaminohydroxyphosphoribosylaminopyrimidine deaminase/5-amino-6-(5-phosphoribosylamino)uracil reductase
VYVTLEPHSYHGRTPPCTEALIRAGVRRVVCSTLDFNPKVHGDGVRQLQAAGIAVEVGLLEQAARELNLGFSKRMQSGLPRVILKVAASLDGRTALANGASQWISGEAARADVQRVRAASSAVLTGIDTVLADDPRLTVRDPAIDMAGRQPLRVVLDTRLRMPSQARMLHEAGATLVITDAAKAAAPQLAPAEVIGLPLDANDRIDLSQVLHELGRRQCNDVLVEAGATLAGRFLELRLVDELVAYVAPVVLGHEARPMFQLPRLEKLQDATRLELHAVERVGGDVKIVLRR